MPRNKTSYLLFLLSLLIFFLNGCSFKTPVDRPTLLKAENSDQAALMNIVDRFARVNSMRAKMNLKFEDNSYAENGIAEKYKTADGEIVVQRPANILLKVQIPIIHTDIVQMTSDGEKFRVAILEDGAGGKYRNFVLGTNDADYSPLQKEAQDLSGDIKKSVNAFSSLRPQHFTDALLVRPIDKDNYSYLTSTINQEEFDLSADRKSPLRWNLRGYYLLDEMKRGEDGTMKITRRFWFDRVGAIRLARQQIFDENDEIESDIVYGKEGNLTDTGDYNNLPLRIEVTRPKEKYKMSLEYQTPATVDIGKTYKPEVFVLKNSWDLPEIDLNKKLEEVKMQQTGKDGGKSRGKN